MLFRKYPGYPDEKQIYFLENLLQNPRHKTKAEEIARKEKILYKNEQAKMKNHRELQANEEKIKFQNE